MADADAMELVESEPAWSPVGPSKLHVDVKKSFDDERNVLHTRRAQDAFRMSLVGRDSCLLQSDVFDTVSKVMGVAPAVHAQPANHVGWTVTSGAAVRLRRRFDAVVGYGLRLRATHAFTTPVHLYVVADAGHRWRADGRNSDQQFKGASCYQLNEDRSDAQVAHGFLAVCYLGIGLAEQPDQWLEVTTTVDATPLCVISACDGDGDEVWVRPSPWVPASVRGFRRSLGVPETLALDCPRWQRGAQVRLSSAFESPAAFARDDADTPGGFFDGGGGMPLELRRLPERPGEYACFRLGDAQAAHLAPDPRKHGRYLVMFDWDDLYWLDIANGWRHVQGRDAFSLCTNVTREQREAARAAASRLTKPGEADALLQCLLQQAGVWRDDQRWTLATLPHSVHWSAHT